MVGRWTDTEEHIIKCIIINCDAKIIYAKMAIFEPLTSIYDPNRFWIMISVFGLW